MTLENCKRLLAHYESKGMLVQAQDMKANMAIKGYKETAKAEPKK